MHLLKETPFSGKDNEDSNKDIEDVLDMVDYFKAAGFLDDKVMLRVFPIALQGTVIFWLKAELSY